MKRKTDLNNNIQNNLIGNANSDREFRQFQAFKIMVSDLLENERKYHIYPQVGKYAKIFRYVSSSKY